MAAARQRLTRTTKAAHVPTPLIVAVVARDDADAIRLPGDSRRGGPYKLALLDVSLLGVGRLLGRDMAPIDAEDLEPAEREHFVRAMVYALEDLQKSQ